MDWIIQCLMYSPVLIVNPPSFTRCLLLVSFEITWKRVEKRTPQLNSWEIKSASVRQPGIKACTIRQLGITRTTASQSGINDKHSYTDSRVSKQPQLHSRETTTATVRQRNLALSPIPVLLIFSSPQLDRQIVMAPPCGFWKTIFFVLFS